MIDDHILSSTRDELHRELRDRRALALAVMTRLYLFYVAIVGWKFSVYGVFDLRFTWFILTVIVFISITASLYLYGLYSSYKTIAGVIVRINIRLGLFGSGEDSPERPIFPERWKRFGKRNAFQVAWIAGVPIFAVITAFVVVWR